MKWILLFGPLLVATSVAQAQTAPELYGRIVDSAGAPIAMAGIVVEGVAAHAWSDAAGMYRLRASRACACRMTVSHVGYVTRTVDVELRNDRANRVDVELAASAVPLAPLHATPEADGARTIDWSAIDRMNAATAGDVLAAIPGVVVTENVPGGAQHIGIRGSGAGHVLVLVDGTPINDPITGVADLSRIHATDIASLSVLPGAHSARYGARALAGVVLIELRGSTTPRQFSAAIGSLGSHTVGLVWSDRIAVVPWSFGVHARRSTGAFAYTLKDVVPAISGTRQNADTRSLEAHAAFDAPVAGGILHVRPSIQSEGRGLPGKAYAPTPAARQSARTMQVSGAWRRSAGTINVALITSYAQQLVRMHDSVPQYGPAYDDTIRLAEFRADLEITRALRAVSVGLRASGRTLGTDASTLRNPGRTTRELSSAVSLQWRPAGRWFAYIDLRADFDRAPDGVRGSHAIMLGREGLVTVQVAHRSSYAPPSLADRYFRESVGIAANPDLRAERVPGELEASLTWRGNIGAARAGFSAMAFTGNTRDLIVWEPDYRFVWSPRNTNVHRRGVDLTAHVTRGHVSLRASYAHNRTTYEHSRGAVQLAYRPRSTGGAVVEYASREWHAALRGQYLGGRNTAPTGLNGLPGFWTFSAAASRSGALLGLPVTGSLRIDRLLNNNDSLIFGFPQPRRTITLELRITQRDPKEEVHP